MLTFYTVVNYYLQRLANSPFCDICHNTLHTLAINSSNTKIRAEGGVFWVLVFFGLFSFVYFFFKMSNQ